MRRLYIVRLIAVACVMSGAAGRATEPAPPANQDGVATTTIRVLQGHYLLPVVVGGTEFTFMIDTGAQCTHIDRSLAGLLNGEAHVRHRDDERFWLKDATISIDNKDFALAEVACEDLSLLRRSSGNPVMGILGMDILGSRVLCLNFDARELRIRESKSATESWEHQLDIEMSDEPRPYVTVQVDGVPIRCLLDTGSAGSIGVDALSFDRLARQKAIRPTYTPNAVARIDYVERGILSLPSTTVDLGSAVCENLIVSKRPADRPYGLLGGLFLSRFNVELDFKHKKMYFSKSRLYAALDCSDYGGIVMEHSWFGVIATGVVQGSMADRAGVQSGDQIVGVGSIDVNTHGERRVVKALQEPRIEDFPVCVRRDGEIHKLNFVVQPVR
jgi:hypothetical protein